MVKFVNTSSPVAFGVEWEAETNRYQLVNLRGEMSLVFGARTGDIWSAMNVIDPSQFMDRPPKTFAEFEAVARSYVDCDCCETDESWGRVDDKSAYADVVAGELERLTGEEWTSGWDENLRQYLVTGPDGLVWTLRRHRRKWVALPLLRQELVPDGDCLPGPTWSAKVQWRWDPSILRVETDSDEPVYMAKRVNEKVPAHRLAIADLSQIARDVRAQIAGGRAKAAEVKAAGGSTVLVTDHDGDITVSVRTRDLDTSVDAVVSWPGWKIDRSQVPHATMVAIARLAREHDEQRGGS